MPLAKEPYDFEYMNHPRGTKVLGNHDSSRRCETRTEQPHDIPAYQVTGYRPVCTREKGHMGRHEAHYTGGEIIASWSPRPHG